MMKYLSTTVAVAGLAFSMVATNAIAAPPAHVPSAAEIQQIQQRNGVLLDAHLAAMKAGLALNDQQAALWPPFEAAIRDAAKARGDRWLQARERMNTGERPSPIERISMMADHLDHNAAELRKVADAGKPLYDSLDDTQKRNFGPLMQELKTKTKL